MSVPVLLFASYADAFGTRRLDVPVVAPLPVASLVDAMRGRSSTWTRIRINLQHVPEALRPAQEPLDPDEKIRSSS